MPVPHNLEPRDATMIKWAVDELDVGVGRPNGFTYIEKPDGTLSVDGYVGDFMPTTLPIPQKLNNKVVTEIAPYAFEGRLDELEVSEISLPNSILTIGEGAFSNNKLLEKVTLENNNSLNTIQSAAFANCEKLESFTIPQTVTNLGDSVFYGCVSMDSYNVEYKKC